MNEMHTKPTRGNSTAKKKTTHEEDSIKNVNICDQNKTELFICKHEMRKKIRRDESKKKKIIEITYLLRFFILIAIISKANTKYHFYFFRKCVDVSREMCVRNEWMPLFEWTYAPEMHRICHSDAAQTVKVNAIKRTLSMCTRGGLNKSRRLHSFLSWQKYVWHLFT